MAMLSEQSLKGMNTKVVALLLAVGLAGAHQAHSETSAT